MDLWKLVAIVVLLIIAVFVFAGVLTSMESGSSVGMASFDSLRSNYVDTESGIVGRASLWSIATSDLPNAIFAGSAVEGSGFMTLIVSVFGVLGAVMGGLALYKIGRAVLGA